MMKKLVMILVMIVFSKTILEAQIRNSSTDYVEMHMGLPLILDGGFGKYFKDGERIYGLGYAIATKNSNYHRIVLDYKKERIDSTAAYYQNITVKYMYESTMKTGKYHLSYLGFMYGVGVGNEKLMSSENNIGTTNVTYPFLSVGLNFEKFIVPAIGLYARAEANLANANISNKIKGNLSIGCKVRIIKNKH